MDEIERDRELDLADTDIDSEIELEKAADQDSKENLQLAEVDNIENDDFFDHFSGALADAEILDAQVMNLPETPEAELSGSELEAFEAAEIEEQEFLAEEQVVSILESLLFSTDRPVSLAAMKQVFQGTNVSNSQIKRVLEQLMVEYASGRRGVTIEEINGGYQLRTKVDNLQFLKRIVKAKPFRLSGPALEVLAIVAYKQPIIKASVDEIRGVESGHLLRALMEKGLVNFAGKSELPGKPMYYQTTRRFLEIFSLRNIRELPSLSEIDELIPEGIGEEQEKEHLSDLTDRLSEEIGQSYSQGEEELEKITEALQDIQTSSEFFEQEKLRAKDQKEAEKAQAIREALVLEDEVSERDKRWLERYEAQFLNQPASAAESVVAEKEEPIGIEEGSAVQSSDSDFEPSL